MGTCPHYEQASCTLSSYMSNNQIVQVTPEICRSCNRCDKPQDINEVTLALAGIRESDRGPGTTLQNIISWFIAQPPNCGCPNRVNLMNAWGKKRCRQELPTILSWLRESALDNDIKYSEFVIATVVKTILYLPGK